MKRILLLILAALLFVSSVNAVVIDGYTFPDYIKNQTNVYIDDSKVRVDVYPHTLIGDGWRYIDFTPKTFTGLIDFGVLFNGNHLNLSSPQYCVMTDFSYIDMDFNLVEYTACDWINLNKPVYSTNFNFDNKDTLKYFRDLNVVAGNTYKVRYWVDMPELEFNQVQWWDSKEGVLFNPSSYRNNLQQSLDNGYLIYLDPWTRGSSNLRTWHSFNSQNISGSTSIDMTYNYNCTMTGLVNVSGKLGEGRDFEKGDSTDQCSFGSTAIGIVNQWSINTWVNIESITSSDKIFSRRPSSNDNNEIRFQLGTNTFEVLIVDRLGSGTGYKYYSSNSTLSTSTWTMLTATWDGTNLELYINGNAQTETKNQDDAVIMTSQAMEVRLGRHATAGNQQFDGIIDEFAIWNDALNATEVNYLYNSSAGCYYKNIAGNNCPPSAAPAAASNFTIQANGYDTLSALSSFNSTINGTLFYSTTSGTITTGLLDDATKTYNVKVNAENHFAITYTNWNVSTNLIANLTEYPRINVYNDWNSSEIINYTVLVNGAPYSNTTGNTIFVPFNTTASVFINVSGYIPRNITFNFTDSNDLNTTIWQSEINIFGKEVVTNTTINTWNLTIGNIVYNATASNISLRPNWDTYTTWLAQANNYYNLTQDYTIDDYYLNFTAFFYTHLLNITINNTGGSPVNNVVVDVDGLNYTFNTTATANGYYEFGLLNGSYRVSIDPPNYNIDSAVINITANDTYLRYNFQVEATNSILFTFYEEGTGTLIDYATISLEMIGDTSTYNSTTTDGTIFIDAIFPDYYTIRYSAPHTTERFYYYTLVNRTTNSINLYLINQSLTSNVTAYVFDENINYLENALIKVLRYDINTNSYILHEMRATNFNGEATLSLVLNEEFYKFVVEYPTGTTELTTTPTYVTGLSLEFQLILAEAVGQTFFNSQGVDYTLTYNNATNNFNFFYNDGYNLVSSGCLYIYKVTYLSDTLFNSSCVNGTTATILVGAPQANGTTYKASAYIYYNSDEYFLKSLFQSWLENANTGNLGLLGIIILTITFAFMGFWSPIIAVILTPIPLVIGSATGLIAITLPITLGVWVLSIVVGYIITR